VVRERSSTEIKRDFWARSQKKAHATHAIAWELPRKPTGNTDHQRAGCRIPGSLAPAQTSPDLQIFSNRPCEVLFVLSKKHKQTEQHRCSGYDHVEPTERQAMTIGAFDLPEREHRSALGTGPDDPRSRLLFFNSAHTRPFSCRDR
jgi:hypothetical protein